MTFVPASPDTLAIILSLAGEKLLDKERDFFREADPLGFILFARNCKSPQQVKALTSELKETLGRDCPILIDQEGGRVQRLAPPAWRGFPAMRIFGDAYEKDPEHALEDLRFSILQLASELVDAGINVDCAPVLDVLSKETHDVIGDRAFSEDPETVSRLGLSVCRNFLAAGITPVIKHIPGHGRAAQDSHKDLPRVNATREELERDLKPFKAVSSADCGQAVWAMSAHVVYEAWDADHPASASIEVIENIIRKDIGFEGFLVSDDVCMDALKPYGALPARTKAVMDAGSDAALYCAGKMKEMEKIAESVPKLTSVALERLQTCAEFTKLAA